MARAELARAQLATAGMKLAHAQLAADLTRTELALHRHSVETRRGLLHRTCRGLLHRSGELRATSELYTGELHMPTSLHYPKQQGDSTLKPHVVIVYFKYF
jgi:hypothetical protein